MPYCTSVCAAVIALCSSSGYSDTKYVYPAVWSLLSIFRVVGSVLMLVFCGIADVIGSMCVFFGVICLCFTLFWYNCSAIMLRMCVEVSATSCQLQAGDSFKVTAHSRFSPFPLYGISATVSHAGKVTRVTPETCPNDCLSFSTRCTQSGDYTVLLSYCSAVVCTYRINVDPCPLVVANSRVVGNKWFF